MIFIFAFAISSISPCVEYLRMYCAFGEMGFRRYPMFQIYFVGAYLLGQRRCDEIIAWLLRAYWK